MKKLFFLFIFTFITIEGVERSLIRGQFFDLIEDPWNIQIENESQSAKYIEDGLLVIQDGIIADIGEFKKLKNKYPNEVIIDYRGHIITPGFIDCHIHYPQTRVVASFGHHLLEWLETYIYPEEQKFTNLAYAREVAKEFFDIILKNGTTTVQSFATTSPNSVIAFFDEATKRNMRVICGLTGLDRKGEAPKKYLDNADSFYKNSKKLIKKYHKKGRNLYAITPRFALGSTKEQLEKCQQLKEEHPDCWVNTHLAETPESSRDVLTLFPKAKDYLGVYESFGLVGAKFTGGHSIYLSDNEFRRLSKSGGAIAFCPCSNFFLGSGLFRLGKSKDPQNPVRVGVGTDMGGGNTFSILQVLNEGYKVGIMNNLALTGAFNLQQKNNDEAERNKLTPYRAMYLATLGGAKALYLDKQIGNFEKGKEADFIVINLKTGTKAIPLREVKNQNQKDMIANKLFGVIMLGDERNIEATYIMGKRLYPN